MPGTGGLEFLQTVREEYPHLPFILFTGKGTEEVASDAISAGVTDYLERNIGTEQYELLANRIRNAVDARREAERANRREQLMGLTEFASEDYRLTVAGQTVAGSILSGGYAGRELEPTRLDSGCSRRSQAGAMRRLRGRGSRRRRGRRRSRLGDRIREPSESSRSTPRASRTP